MADKYAQAFSDDYRSIDIEGVDLNMSPAIVAKEQAKVYEEGNRLILRDLGERLTPQQWSTLMNAINNYSYRMSGAGSLDYQYQQAFIGFDKYAYNPLPMNTLFSGYTFITRPKLNLSPGAVAHNSVLGLLENTAPNSPMFAIRCMLDTNFCSRYYEQYAQYCMMVDTQSPFIKLLTNCSRSNSGWPDFNADTYTTEGGYFNEDQTTFLGFDDLNRTYDLSLEFTDIQGGHVMALFYYWFLYMFYLKKGNVMAYAEDINMRRLCYTCSIYRFLVDPSRQVIVAWSKATGCFPKSVPIGALFNQNSGEIHVSSAQRFSIPFTANKIEYNKQEILTDFNTVTRRFCPQIPDGCLVAPINDPGYNFIGRPYVRTFNGAHRLMWYYIPDEEPGNSVRNTIAQIREQVKDQPVPIEATWDDLEETTEPSPGVVLRTT